MARKAMRSLLKLTYPLRIRLDRGYDYINPVLVHCHCIIRQLSDKPFTESRDIDTRVGRGILLQEVEDFF